MLPILLLLCRRWALVRLKHLRPWIKEWANASPYGISGAGADDAWWMSALDVEFNRLEGNTVTGGAADIWKCFAQIPRELLYDFMRQPGMPKKVVSAYMRFRDNLDVVNALAVGLGKRYRKKCSIPQGCPFSMITFSLMMGTLEKYVTSV